MKMKKNWKCQECGRRMTLARAQRIVELDERCDCGGVDIDLASPIRRAERDATIDR